MSGAPALEGDLRHFLPAEVLQFLKLAEATGRLELERSGERAELLFRGGHPVSARTNAGSVRLGEILLHRGSVTPDSLERALAEQERRPLERLGALLVKSGSASREQVAQGVRDVLKRILYGLMLWQEGRFRFVPGEPAEAGDIELDLDLDRLILEGLKQADQARGTA